MKETPSGLPTGERARWERLALDPYYAVLNEDRFRLGSPAEGDRARFAASGDDDVGVTLAEIRRYIDADFAPARAIDFGCGVGRLTVPLARVCREVTALDISERMLDEARRYCASHGVRNVSFATPEAFLAQPAGEAMHDFVHSYIVFQHIPPRTGLRLADALLRRLAPGGVGALHFTYARRASPLRHVVHRLRRIVPGLNVLANVVQGRPLREPLIPMNRYDLAALFALLEDHGCTPVHARLTNHGGHLGAMLLFRRALAQQ